MKRAFSTQIVVWVCTTGGLMLQTMVNGFLPAVRMLTGIGPGPGRRVEAARGRARWIELSAQ